MRPIAVILDFDGVIVDSLAAHLTAWCQAVATVFRRPLPEPGELAGHATRTIAHILCRRYGDPSLVPALIAEKERRLAEGFGELSLIGGAREFLAALQSQRIPHGIASNSPRAFVTGALAATGLAAPVVVTGDDVSRPKPEPDIFWECSNRLGIDPKERGRITVYEDSAHGIKAAIAAGMTAIGIGKGADAEKLLSAGATAVCADLAAALAKGGLITGH